MPSACERARFPACDMQTNDAPIYALSAYITCKQLHQADRALFTHFCLTPASVDLGPHIEQCRQHASAHASPPQLCNENTHLCMRRLCAPHGCDSARWFERYSRISAYHRASADRDRISNNAVNLRARTSHRLNYAMKTRTYICIDSVHHMDVTARGGSSVIHAFRHITLLLLIACRFEQCRQLASAHVSPPQLCSENTHLCMRRLCAPHGCDSARWFKRYSRISAYHTASVDRGPHIEQCRQLASAHISPPQLCSENTHPCMRRLCAPHGCDSARWF